MEDQLCRPERHIEMTLCLNIMFGFSLKIAPLNLLAFLFFQIFCQTRLFCHCWLVFTILAIFVIIAYLQGITFGIQT